MQMRSKQPQDKVASRQQQSAGGGQRETQERKDKQNQEHQYHCIRLCAIITEALPRTDRRPRTVPPEAGHPAT